MPGNIGSETIVKSAGGRVTHRRRAAGAGTVHGEVRKRDGHGERVDCEGLETVTTELVDIGAGLAVDVGGDLDGARLRR